LKLFSGRSVLFALLLALISCLFWMNAQSAQKGRISYTDELLNQGFESEEWAINWTVIDADESGSSWERLARTDYYVPRNGQYSIGCRFNESGDTNDDWLITPPLRVDSLKHVIKFYYKSQDVNYLESIEILSLESTQTLSRAELESGVANELFSIEHAESSIPADWQEFSLELPIDTSAVWYFGIRCSSQDKFVLLVDDVSGLYTIPVGHFYIEPEFERLDFGVLPADSFALKTFRMWNLREDSTLYITMDTLNMLEVPFYLYFDNLQVVGGDTLAIQPEDSLGFVLSFEPTIEDSVNTGSFSSLIKFDVLGPDSIKQDQRTLSVSGLAWDEEFVGLSLSQDFEGDSPASKWDGWVSQSIEDCATDTTGWQIDETASSLNFSIPAGSNFAYINSDAAGQWDSENNPLVQCDLLISPWFAAAEIDNPQALLMGYHVFYDDRNGGLLSIYADSTGTGWDLIDLPSAASYYWDMRTADLSDYINASQIRVAFRFEGNWSYGVALDEINVYTTDLDLPEQIAPSPPQEPQDVIVSVFPNPFNPLTTISYQATLTGRLNFSVYNILGQQVYGSENIFIRKGLNKITLKLENQASGLYFLQLVNQPADGSRVIQTLRKITYIK
jgi:hypothetical protein